MLLLCILRWMLKSHLFSKDEVACGSILGAGSNILRGKATSRLQKVVLI